MLHQSWASARCASVTHFTLGLRSVCQRNFYLDYKNANPRHIIIKVQHHANTSSHKLGPYNFKGHRKECELRANNISWKAFSWLSTLTIIQKDKDNGRIHVLPWSNVPQRNIQSCIQGRLREMSLTEFPKWWTLNNLIFLIPQSIESAGLHASKHIAFIVFIYNNEIQRVISFVMKTFHYHPCSDLQRELIGLCCMKWPLISSYETYSTYLPNTNHTTSILNLKPRLKATR